MVDSARPHTRDHHHGLVTCLCLGVPRPDLRLDVALTEPSLLSNFRAVLYLGIFNGSVLLLTKYVIFKKGNCTAASSTRSGRFCRAQSTRRSHCRPDGSACALRVTCCPLPVCKEHQDGGKQAVSPIPASHIPESPSPGVQGLERTPDRHGGPRAQACLPPQKCVQRKLQPPISELGFHCRPPPFPGNDCLRSGAEALAQGCGRTKKRGPHPIPAPVPVPVLVRP